MTYNEKKSLYESIMKDIAKTVKHKINEAGVANIEMNDNTGIGFKDLNRFLYKPGVPSKNLIIETSNDDLQFAVLLILGKVYESIYRINVAGKNSDELLKELKSFDSNKYRAIVIDDLNYADKSVMPIILNLADGRLFDKKILRPVICLATDLVGQLDAAPIRQRFVYLRLKY